MTTNKIRTAAADNGQADNSNDNAKEGDNNITATRKCGCRGGGDSDAAAAAAVSVSCSHTLMASCDGNALRAGRYCNCFSFG